MVRDFTELELLGLKEAFRRPVGRYSTARAAQLSGAAGGTLEGWAYRGYLTPDYSEDWPKAWSYRDVVFARLFLYLREKGMRPEVCQFHVADLKQTLAGGADLSGIVTGDNLTVVKEEEDVDRRTQQSVITDVRVYLGRFDLFEALEGPARLIRWGPDLRHPSDHTSISPQVMSGDPCVDGTRIPSQALFNLAVHRGLSDEDIAQLYPDLETSSVSDALALERKLRGLDKLAA